MDPTTPEPDDAIDSLLRDAAPRAPRGFADGVLRRIEVAAGARRRRRARLVSVGALVAVAAALVLWLARPTTNVRLAPSGWSVVAQAGLTMTAPDGRPARDPDVGVQLVVGHGGAATLERALARVTLAQDSRLRVAAGGALQLSTGGARLEGPETRVDGDVATVTTLGVSADIAVQLERRTNMNAKNVMLATVMTVAAHGGGALVQAREHTPVLLAQNDRATVMGTLPPLVNRAPVLLANNDAKKPAPAKPATKSPATTSDVKATATPEPGDLDKATIRRVIQGSLNDIKDCYEKTLETEPNLSGKTVVRMSIVTRDGKGVVDEADVLPQGEGDLVSPRFEQCLLDVVGKMQFPPPLDGKMTVDNPFILKQ